MQKMSRPFYQRLRDLEGKGIIRRVRTPAGALKFGQPIGTIIKPDLNIPAMAAAPRGAKRVKTSRSGNRNLKQNPSPKRIKSLDEIPMVREDTDDKSLHREVGLFGAHTVTKHVADEDTSIYSAYLGRNFIANYIDTKDDERPFSVSSRENFIAQLNKYRDLPAPQRKPRETSALWDYWEGTYGWDWQNEGDDFSEEDFDKPLKRMQIANQESKDIGIQVNGYIDRYGEHVAFDPGVHEVINSNMRAYKEMYPGFMKLIDFIGLEDMTTGTYAYNKTKQGEGGRKNTKIMFNSKYVTQTEDDVALTAWAKSDAKSAETGFFSLENMERLAEDNDMELWQVATLSTLNHELGHTIGRMIFGEINTEHDNLYPQWEGIDSAAWREEFSANVTPILDKYGMIVREDALDDADTTDQWMTSFGRDRPNSLGWSGRFPKHSLPRGFRKELVSSHLSRYGATNLHEIMAETWASYIMEEEPTEFVQELGEAMEGMMMLWLEEAGLDK